LKLQFYPVRAATDRGSQARGLTMQQASAALQNMVVNSARAYGMKCEHPKEEDDDPSAKLIVVQVEN
jgi:hypothetical protein